MIGNYQGEAPNLAKRKGCPICEQELIQKRTMVMTERTEKCKNVCRQSMVQMGIRKTEIQIFVMCVSPSVLRSRHQGSIKLPRVLLGKIPV